MPKQRTPRTHADDSSAASRPTKLRRSKVTGAPPPDSLGAQPGAEGREPTDEEIRLRAYERYLERGGRDGMAFEDWLQAERELKSLKSEV